MRIPLAEGEWILGSSPEADIHIAHPTVSRRHAQLFVTQDQVEILDLGSSNGTRIDGEKLRGRKPVPPGRALLFGTAVALLEILDEEDRETGIAMPGASAAPKGKTGEASFGMTTIGPSILEFYTRDFLPGILGKILDGVTETERTQAIGHGLFSGLPCRSVEIVQVSGSGEALVFSAERSSRREDDPGELEKIEVSRGQWSLRVDFPLRKLAEACEPLLQSAADLAALAPGIVPEPKDLGRKFPKNPPEPPSPPSLSPAVRKIYSNAAKVAIGKISVLIHGESGTGKELLARYIHRASPRAEGPLVNLNCAALPRDLLEAELFGVEKGAATGVESRPGRFEQADGGTLVLDEIGDMAPETQARILRVLQEQEVFRLGATRPRKVDVRIVSATNRNLEQLMAEGKFRPDLFHRIADWVVELPPLRQRREDIPNLAIHFLSEAARKIGVAPAGISKRAVEILGRAPWPGNIRQLEREMSRVALFLSDGDLLESSHLQLSLLSQDEKQSSGGSLRNRLEEAEKAVILEVLEVSGGDVVEAARLLEIGRSTLYRRMAALEIE